MNSTQLPLFGAQRDIWIGAQLEGATPAYVISQQTDLVGFLDESKFRAAAAHVLGHTEALRLSFSMSDRGVSQAVSPPREDALELRDVSSASDPYACALAIAAETAGAGIRVDKPPLFRWVLVRLSPSRHLWIESYHHIVVDGFSGWKISERVAEAYSALAEGRPLGDFNGIGIGRTLADECAYRESPKHHADRDWWIRTLEATTAPERARGLTRVAVAGDFHRTELCSSEELSRRLRERAKALAVTPGRLVAAATAILESLHQCDHKVVLGIPLLGRSAVAATRDPAMTVNTGCLVLDASPEKTVGDLVADVGEKMLTALRRQGYRHEGLRRDLGLKPTNPDLYRVSFNLMPFVSELTFSGLAAETTHLSFGPAANLSVTVFDHESRARVGIVVDGNKALHQPEDVAVYAGSLECMLRGLLEAAPETQLGRLQFAAPPVHGPHVAEPHTICEILACRPQHTAGMPAILTSGHPPLCHGELAKRSDALARRLIASGARADTVIAVALTRTPSLAVAVLGVLKSGAVCLPLDPSYPAYRIRQILQESAAFLIIAEGSTAVRLSAVDVEQLNIDEVVKDMASPEPLRAEDLERAISPDDVAFLLFTSGSTGRPKGVAISHEAVANKLLSQQELFTFTHASRFAHTASVAFDPSLHQLLLPLVTGGASILLTETELQNASAFWRRLAETHATHLDLVPSYASALLHGNRRLPPSLQVLIFGGEPLPARLVEDVRGAGSKVRVFNMYGPTEACIDAIGCELSDASEPHPSIGRALRGYFVYILDQFLRPTPPGVAGEIYIGGVGMARGYWNHPELTAECFIADPFGPPGTRMYRTGDLASIGNTGRIRFLGRSDAQLKIRGIRIEKGDVENALRSIPGVRDGVVELKTQMGRSFLVGYATLDNADSHTKRSLRDALGERIAASMLPDVIMILETLPLTPSGKIDRSSLPDVEIEQECAVVETESQRVLCEMFAELTGMAPGSVDQNFFDLGGDSLGVLRLEAEIALRFGVEIPLRRLFERPTVRAIDDWLKMPLKNECEVLLRLNDSSGVAVIYCVHAVAGIASVYRPLAQAMQDTASVVGLQLPAVGHSAPPASIPQLAAEYVRAIRRKQTHGPYWLLGWSFGGVVAHEMALELERAGEPVGGVFLLDTYFGWKDVAPLPDNGALDEQERALLLKNLKDLPAGLREQWDSHFSRCLAGATAMMAAHRPSVIAAAIHYLRASDNHVSDLRNRLATLTSGDVSIVDIDARHYDFADASTAPDLAHRIGSTLAI